MAGEEEIVETNNMNKESIPDNDTVKENNNDEVDNHIEQENSESGPQEASENEKPHTQSVDTETLPTDSQNQTHETNGHDVEDVTERLTQDPSSPNQSSNEKLMKLPLSRIKVIMKSDPDVTLASQEAVITLTKATELFIAALSKDAVVSTINCKRKTLQRKDLDAVLDTRDFYAFLEGTLD